MVPILSEEQRIDLIFINMLSSITRLIRRDEVKSVDQLVKQAVELERAESDEKYFRPSLPPETSIFPHLAYNPTNPKSKLKTATASTAATSSRSTDFLADEIVESLRKRLDSGKKKKFYKAQGTSRKQVLSRGKVDGKAATTNGG